MKLRDFRAFYKYCVTEELAEKDMAKRISFVTSVDVWRYITTKEMQMLMDAAKHCQDLPEIMAIAANTGLRISELLAVERRSIINEHYIFVPKKKRGRNKMVPITDQIAPIIKNRLILSSKLFPGWSVGRLEQAWGRAKDRAEIEGRMRFHDFRHTFASNYLMAGGKEGELMVILGHTNLKTTQIYSHFANTYLRANMNKMEFNVIIPKFEEYNETSKSKKIDGIWTVVPKEPVARVAVN